MQDTIALQQTASTRAVVYWCLLLGGLMIPSSLDMVEWQGTSATHNVMELTSAVMAFIVGAFVLRYYRAQRHPSILLIAAGFLGAGMLDGFHGLVAIPALAGVFDTPQVDITAWSWFASRLFLASMLLLSCIDRRRLATAGERGQTHPGLRLFGPLLVAAIIIFALENAPLPSGYVPGMVLHRPQELIVAAVFMLALISAMRGGAWRQNVFAHWIILSILTGLICHVLIMPLSSAPFDAQFDAAHATKLISYALALTGCVLSLMMDTPVTVNDAAATPVRHGMSLGIGTKTAILCGLVALLAVTPTAIQSSRTMHQMVLQVGMDQLAEESRATGTALDRRLANAERDLLALATTGPIAGLYRARRDGGFDKQQGGSAEHWQLSLTGLLQNWVVTHPEYRAIRYVDAESGEVLAQLGVDDAPSASDIDLTGGDIPDGISWSRIVSRAANGNDMQPLLTADVTLPAYSDDGLRIGVFRLRLDVTDILTGASDNDARRYVVDDTGVFLIHADGAAPSGARRLATEFPGLIGQLTSPDAGGAVLLDDDGAREVAAGIYRSDTRNSRQPLLFISSRSRDAIELPAAEIGRQRRLSGQLTFTLAIVIGWFVAQLLARPVQTLARAAQEFGQTGRRPDIPVTTHDEVGRLGVALGRMMGQVEQRSRQLEEQAEQRRLDLHTIAAAEARYRAVIDNMADAQVICDSHGTILSFNPAAEEIFGYTKDEAIGQSASILLPEPLKSRLKSNIDHYLQTGQRSNTSQKHENESEAVRKDGSLFPVALRFDIFEIDSERFFSVMIKDITDAKQIRERLQRLATAVESAAEGIVILDAESRIQYVNPAFLRYTQHSIEELQGRRASDISAPEADPEKISALREAMACGETWSGILNIRRPDGRLHSEETTVSPIRDPASGRITNYVSVIRDVTERIQMEQQLRQAQKLESIGQLAAGIAHEINTPTQYVSDNTVFLQRAFAGLMDAVAAGNALLATARTGQVDDDAITTAEAAFKKAKLDFLQKQVPPAFEQSLEGLEQVSRIVSAMKEFSHPAQDKTGLDLNRAIQSTITVASSEWKYVAEMHTEFDESLPHVPCLPGEFNQVILNIIVNAAHAIGDVVGDGADGRGQITVTTRHVDDYAEIRIGDTGAGMSEDVRARIFDAFFTTKEVGKGTGQGLAIAYNVIVDKHDGTIDVESAPGAGTTFVIRLPLTAPADDADGSAAEKAA